VPRPRTHDDRTGRVFPEHLITYLHHFQKKKKEEEKSSSLLFYHFHTIHHDLHHVFSPSPSSAVGGAEQERPL
jgi:hypothetical protein